MRTERSRRVMTSRTSGKRAATRHDDDKTERNVTDLKAPSISLVDDQHRDDQADVLHCWCGGCDREAAMDLLHRSAECGREVEHDLRSEQRYEDDDESAGAAAVGPIDPGGEQVRQQRRDRNEPDC
jgi:hypothetical protein